MARAYRRFADFYPIYLRMHDHPTCRRLHLAGNALALVALLVAAAARNPWALVAVPVLSNGCAWIGHVFFQKNRPGVLAYPLYGTLGNWMMMKDVLTGKSAW